VDYYFWCGISSTGLDSIEPSQALPEDFHSQLKIGYRVRVIAASIAAIILTVDYTQERIREWEDNLEPVPLPPPAKGEEEDYPPGLVEQLKALGYMR